MRTPDNASGVGTSDQGGAVTPASGVAAVGSPSLDRRLRFAGDVSVALDRALTWWPLSAVTVQREGPLTKVPAHAARVGFDLVECLRTGKRVPDIGDVEMTTHEGGVRVSQHPRYVSFWHDRTLRSVVALLVGVDLIRCGGKYYVIEFNHGPSLYPRRRRLYASALDPIVSGILEAGRALGVRRVVPIAYRWREPFNEEFARGGEAFGLAVEPFNCPLAYREVRRRLVALPKPLEPDTLYVIHSGLWTPVFRFLDDKWATARWLSRAIEHEMPADTLVRLPRTSDRLFVPSRDPGPRWPNLLVKLARGARSRQVIAGRFTDVDHARRVLGLGRATVPRSLRAAYARSRFFGRNRVIYQEYVPPDLNRLDHARVYRMHLLVSPSEARHLSTHARVSTRPVPEEVPRGIIGQDDALIYNDATYEPVRPMYEEELEAVAAELGGAIARAIARTFVTGIGDDGRRPRVAAGAPAQ